MFANSMSGGIAIGFPNVCKTPAPAPPPVPIPIPYPNICPQPTAMPKAFKIFYCGTPAHNMSSIAPTSNGDEPGRYMGVASQTAGGPGRQLTGSFKVLLMGMPATKLTSVTNQNLINAPGVTIAPSQVKVVMLAP